MSEPPATREPGSARGVPRVGGLIAARTFWVLVRAGVRRFTTYRLAALAGVVANVTFGYIRGAVLLAVAGASSVAAAKYSADGLMTYNWLTQASLGALALWGTGEVAERVRDGSIAVDLARPVDLMTAFLAQDLGRAVAALVLRGLPTLIVGGLTTGLALSADPLPWVLGAVAITMALIISFLARFAMQTAAFWILDLRGPQTLYMVVAGLFAGLVFPVPLMPEPLRLVATLTPFPSMMQYPVDVFSGRVVGEAAWWLLAQQAGWVVALVILGRVLLAAGTRRLVVQGG